MMSKVKSSFLSGAIILTFCSVITKLLSAIYKIPLLKILGSDGLGGFQMVIGVYALFLVISSGGIVTTMSKVIAREEKFKNKTNQKRYLVCGFLLTLVMSTIFAIFLMIISRLIAKFQGIQELCDCYLIVAPSIIFSGLVSVFRGFFLGKRKMLNSGSVLIFEAGVKLFLSLFLASQFGRAGILKAVFGAVLGISLTELASFVYIFGLYLFCKKRQNENGVCVLKNGKKIKLKFPENQDVFKPKFERYIPFWAVTKNIFKTNFMISLQALIFPLITAIDGILIVPLLIKSGLSQSISYSLFGLEDGVVSTILSMPLVVATSIGSAIVPTLNAEKKSFEIVKKGVNIVWLVSVFCAVTFIFFAGDITKFLYGGGLSSAGINELGISSDLLKISGFNIIYTSLLSLSTFVLQGLDRSLVPIKNLVLAGLFRFVILFASLSSKQLNIYGMPLANMAFYSVASILNLIKIKQITGIKFDLSKIFVLPTFCVLFMLTVMIFAKSLLWQYLSFRALTLIVMAVGGLVYVCMLFVTKVLSFDDITVFKHKKIKTN